MSGTSRIAYLLRVFVGCLGLATAAVVGQEPSWTAPRTAWGDPDVQGYWATGGFAFTLEKGGMYNEDLRLSAGNACLANPSQRNIDDPGLIVDPEPGGKLPFQPWAAARKKTTNDNYNNPAGNIGLVDPNTRCLLPGVPRFHMSTPYNGYQILQRPGAVMLLGEWNHVFRIIPLDDRPHVGSNIRLFMGDSRGRWEGNTLVVDVTNFTDKTWLDIVGAFHSDALHVVERYTRTDDDTIKYEARIEDPKVFTRPWHLAFEYKRPRAAEYELYEYACHEGNKAIENIFGTDYQAKLFRLAMPARR
jgi:hypothetical protein